MAKGNRTTSTARCATTAKGTSAAKERICQLEDKTEAEAFGLGHLVSITAETIDSAAAAFGTLRHEIKMLNELLGNITDVSNMTHELLAAEKADPVSTHNYRRHCQARAYKTLQPLLYAASRQNAQVEADLADFLKASPVLAHNVARWQADDAKI
jgi:hypothetical protein